MAHQIFRRFGWLLALHLAVSCAAGDAPLDSAVLYDEYTDCGPTSGFVIARILGANVEWETFRQDVGESPDGMASLTQVERALRHAGLYPVGVFVEAEDLVSLPSPAIVRVAPAGAKNDNAKAHLVAAGWDSTGVYVLDPPRPVRRISWDQFTRSYTGHALLVTARPEDEEAVRAALADSLRIPLTLGTLAVACCLAWTVGAARWRKLAKPAGSSRNSHFAGGVVVAAVGGVVAWWWGWRWTDNGQPEAVGLIVPAAPLQLGELGLGRQSVQVPLRNAATEPIRILKIESGCSCAVANWPQSIPPESVMQATIELDVVAGPRAAMLAVYADDQAQPRLVRLEWTGPDAPKLLPPRIDVRNATADVPIERTLEVLYPGGRGAVAPVLTGFRCDDERVQVEVADFDSMAYRTGVTENGLHTVGALRVRLRVVPSGDLRTIFNSCALTVQYGDIEHELKFPLRVSFTGPAGCKPESLVFSSRQRAGLKGQSRTVRVRAVDSEQPARVLEQPPWLECIPRGREGNETIFEVRLLKVPDESDEPESVVFDPGLAAGEPLALPISILCTE